MRARDYRRATGTGADGHQSPATFAAMRRKGLLGLAVAAILLAGCGGGDDGGEDSNDAQAEEAQQVVSDAIAAYARTGLRGPVCG